MRIYFGKLFFEIFHMLRNGKVSFIAPNKKEMEIPFAFRQIIEVEAIFSGDLSVPLSSAVSPIRIFHFNVSIISLHELRHERMASA